MSTAGKVLVVLNVLLLGVWTFLAAAVDQNNVNWAKGIEKIKADMVKVQADLEETKAKADQTLHKVTEHQIAKERDMRLVLMRVSAAERQLSNTNESLSRVKIQLDNYKAAVETAKNGLEARKAEKAKLEKDKADEEALVKRLQGENADKTGELVSLRDEFVAKLKENQTDVEKQLKGGKPLTRRASLIRE